MSTSAGESGFLRLGGEIEERKFDGLQNLVVNATSADATEVLLRLVAINYGLLSSVTLESSTSGTPRLRVHEGEPSGRCTVVPSNSLWTIRLSSDGLAYLCRFLLEMALGIAAVDHVDLEDTDSESVEVTFRVAASFATVDEAEARRRLGM